MDGAADDLPGQPAAPEGKHGLLHAHDPLGPWDRPDHVARRDLDHYGRWPGAHHACAAGAAHPRLTRLIAEYAMSIKIVRLYVSRASGLSRDFGYRLA